jgi:hypothetical protein
MSLVANKKNTTTLRTGSYDLVLFTPQAMKRAEEVGLDTLDRASLHTYIRTKAKDDKQYFMDRFLKHWKIHDGILYETPPIHLEIDKRYEANEDLVVLFPRGHGKTTRTLVNILHELIYFPRTDILYISSAGLGAISIGKIRIELELNPMIKEVYGTLSPRDEDSREIRSAKLKVWKQSYLELLNGSSLETLSKGSSIRGRRKHRVVVDDPQENKDVKTKRIVDEFEDFILTSVYGTMLPGRGSMVVLGTMVGKRCLVKSLRDEHERTTIEYKAIEKGKAVRPALWSLEALEKRRKKLGTPRFNQEYLHIPLSSEDALVELKRIVKKPIKEFPKKYLRRLMVLDPAQKEKRKNDYSGFVHLGITDGGKDEDGNQILKKWVLSSLKVKLKAFKLKQFTKGLYKRWKEPDYIVKEDNIETLLTQELVNDGYPVV